MKKFGSIIALAILTTSLSGCGLMEDAFKAGVIFTIIIAAIIGIIIWALSFVLTRLSRGYKLETLPLKDNNDYTGNVK